MEKDNILSDFELSSEDKKQLMEEIKYFFAEERDEKIGFIASEKVLEFFLKTLGKHIYNKALDDAMKWYQSNMENLEADFYSIYKH